MHFTSNDHDDCLPQNLFCGLNNKHTCKRTLETMGNVIVFIITNIISLLFIEILMYFMFILFFAIKWSLFLFHTMPQSFPLEFMLS